jgi:hypothetical protein
MTGAVDHQVPALHDGRSPRTAPPQRPNPSDQFVKRERLAEVVISAELETVHPVVDIGRGGEHEDAAGRSGTDQFPADAVAVDPGQVAVEHDHVVVGGDRVIERRAAVVDDVDGQARVAQPLTDAFGQRDVILHDQHSHPPIVPPDG